MSAIDFIRKQTTDAHNQLEIVINGVPQDKVNATPAGTANSIGATYAHTVIAADMFFNVALGGGAPTLFTGGFAQKLGVGDPNPRNWEAIKALDVNLAVWREYATAVYASAQAYLGKLTAAELDRKFNAFGMDTSVTDMLVLATTHAALSAGDISATKGTLGLQGYPD
jgi:uncharacterized damage-inducible protein DinB